MARIEINGDLKCFSSAQLEKIYITLNELNFRDKEVSIEPFGSTEDKFSSDIKVIKVKVSDEETFKLILKSSLNPEISDFMPRVYFSNELTIYTEILPPMVEMQEKSGVIPENIIKYAKCYGVNQEEAQEMIFLEDLTVDNYEVLDKLKPLSNDTVKLVLHSLAIFHSLSYVLKTSNRVKFSELCKKLLDVALEGFELVIGNFIFLEQILGNMFDDEKYKIIMKKAISAYVTTDMNFMRSDYDSKYSVIIHGDLRENNILFQLKDDTPSKCVLIDYQQSKVSLPVSDIFHLIFNCTDYETRHKHCCEWLEFYHSELDKSLCGFGLKVANVYPRDQFDSDLKRYASSNLGRIFITSILFQKDHKEADLFNYKGKHEDGSGVQDSVTIMKKKLESIIDSCLDFGYLSG